MRTNLIIGIIIALSMILCPLAATGSEKSEDYEEVGTVAVTEDKQEEYISVMSPLTGKVNEVELKEYIVGSVAAEMSPLYHTEALRAQAVACYTYAKRISENNSVDGADITDDSDTHQGYKTKSEREEMWGENFEEYENKIESAVDSVLGTYMVYDGETVLAVYHSNSAGRTQSAKSLWGSDIPYLISVESSGDKLAPNYITVSEYTESEFEECVSDCGVTLSGDADEWIEKINTDDSGYVTSLVICGKEITASVFRTAFGLKSPCFEIDYDGSFVITCKGYGHGAGMSQYGADYMARQGFSYKEILSHYYSGVEFAQQR